MSQEKQLQTPEKVLFTASNTPEATTQTAILKLEDSPVNKLAGCLSFDYYNITFKCQVTKNQLGKFLDFLLNAKWSGQWGSIDVEEIIEVKKTDPPVYTNVSEYT